jgi:hypothetical protein
MKKRSLFLSLFRSYVRFQLQSLIILSSFFHSHTHTHTHTHTHSHYHTITLSHYHTITLSHYHTITLSHTFLVCIILLIISPLFSANKAILSIAEILGEKYASFQTKSLDFLLAQLVHPPPTNYLKEILKIHIRVCFVCALLVEFFLLLHGRREFV